LFQAVTNEERLAFPEQGQYKVNNQTKVQINLLVSKRRARLTIALEQGCQTYGPRDKTGPLLG